MGSIVDMTLPRLGETMEEGRIVTWLKQPGERFRRGETLLEVETDKTVVECPALVDGTLITHLAKPDERIPVDGIIARIEVEGEGTAAAARQEAATPVAATAASRSVARAVEKPGKVRASGKARALARNKGIDLTKLSGSGRNSRIGAADVEAASTGSTTARVILIHGLFADAASFSLLRLMLERTGFSVEALELPHHGNAGDDASTVDDAVKSLRARLPGGELILVGHSLGALIAAKIAAGLGSRLRQLVLLAPAGFGLDISSGFVDAMLAARNEDQLIDALQMLGPARVSRGFATEQLERIARRRAGLTRLISSAFDGNLQKIAITAELSRLQVPVTAIFGRDDPIVPAHHALAAPPNVEVRIVSGSGHVMHWYQADYIIGLLRK